MDSESKEKGGTRMPLTQFEKVSDTTFPFLFRISSHTMFIVRLNHESEAIGVSQFAWNKGTVDIKGPCFAHHAADYLPHRTIDDLP